MIEKVSSGQGFMAVMKAVLVWLLCVVGGCGGCVYLVSSKVFFQADKIAKEAVASVHPGQPLKEVLSVESPFMKAVLSTLVPSIDFGNPGKQMSGGGNECGTLMYTTSKSLMISYRKGTLDTRPVDMIVRAGQDWGAEFVEKHAADLHPCKLITMNLIKGALRHCPVVVEYDRDLKVVKASTRPCWD